MSDNNQPGASSPTPGAANTGDNPGFGVFAANRGSGLARGKRPAPAAAASAAPAAPSGYKPSSLEVITTKSEYVNPFTGETAVDAPRANEPQPAPAPAPVAAPQAAPAPIAVAPIAPATIESAPTAPAPQADLFPLDAPAVSAEKASLNILPPQEAKRPAVSWESSAGAPAAQPRREERPSFQPNRERRDNREGREAKPFEPREPRRDERKFEPRDKQAYQPRDPRDERPDRAPRAESPATAPAKKSGGFFGWLKGLFGGGKSAETPATGGGEQRNDRDGEHGGRRRHRGGRGRGRGGFDGQNRGGGQPFQHPDPRDETGTPHQGGDQHHDEPRGEHHGEHRDSYQGGGGGRRRRRGGRGRFRGEGGGDRGPRPEGQQGGGAI